jgi:hypothetical protein
LDLVPERVVRTDDVSSIAMFSGRSNWEDVMWVNIRKYYRAFKEDAVKELLELIRIAVAVLQRNRQRRPTQQRRINIITICNKNDLDRTMQFGKYLM